MALRLWHGDPPDVGGKPTEQANDSAAAGTSTTINTGINTGCGPHGARGP